MCPHNQSLECGRWLMFIKKTGCAFSSGNSLCVIFAEPHHVFWQVPSPFCPTLYHFWGHPNSKNLTLGTASRMAGTWVWGTCPVPRVARPSQFEHIPRMIRFGLINFSVQRRMDVMRGSEILTQSQQGRFTLLQSICTQSWPLRSYKWTYKSCN